MTADSRIEPDVRNRTSATYAAGIRRRTLLVGLGATFVIPCAADAQPGGRMWRVGYLSRAAPEFDKHWVSAFKQGLRELGYVEGQNIVVDQRHAAGRAEKLPELAAELVRLPADVIVVYGVPAAVHAVKKASGTVPIVMAVAADPVGDAVVASLARPGGQVTGLSDSHADLVPKRLELLKEVVPSAARVAVLLNPAYPSAARQFKQLEAAAPLQGSPESAPTPC
jgi:putative ABC transport system substrate-binding protein